MEDKLLKYETQINEIVLFAKRINYNIDNGIDDLMLLWLQDGFNFQKNYNDNKEEFINIIKKLL